MVDRYLKHGSSSARRMLDEAPKRSFIDNGPAVLAGRKA